MKHHATITVLPASIRVISSPIRQRVKVAGVEVDAGSPFVRLLHRLYASVLDAETRAEACRVALDNVDDAADDTYRMARQAWLTAQARALGVRQAIVTPTDNAYPQARVEITLGDHLTAEGRSCKDTGYITGGVTRQDIYAVLDEADAR